MPVVDGSQRARMARQAEARSRGNKWCARCESEKSQDDFGVSRHSRDGLAVYCKLCTRAINAAYQSANPEKYAKRHKAWRLANPERARAHGSNSTARRKVRIAENYVEPIDRQVVYERDEGICGICDTPVDRDSFDVDHVEPLVLGGRHAYDNVRLAHVSCNRRRGRSLHGAGVTQEVA